jgi:hypothetical protein
MATRSLRRPLPGRVDPERRAEPGFVPVTPAPCPISAAVAPHRSRVNFYTALIFYISCVNIVEATNNGPVVGFDRAVQHEEALRAAGVARGGAPNGWRCIQHGV